jgi:hypothetical protein
MLFVVVRLPPPTKGGGGGRERAIADSQNRLGAEWGQVKVTYCRRGWGVSVGCVKKMSVLYLGCQIVYRVFLCVRFEKSKCVCAHKVRHCNAIIRCIY